MAIYKPYMEVMDIYLHSICFPSSHQRHGGEFRVIKFRADKVALWLMNLMEAQEHPVNWHYSSGSSGVLGRVNGMCSMLFTCYLLVYLSCFANGMSLQDVCWLQGAVTTEFPSEHLAKFVREIHVKYD